MALVKNSNSKEFNQLVDNSIREMEAMTQALVNSGENYIDAKLRVQQIYLHNLETMSHPATASIALLAELKTRIDIDRVINPEKEILSDRYIELLDQMRKTINLVHTTQKAAPQFKEIQTDDASMKFPKFIDIEVENGTDKRN